MTISAPNDLLRRSALVLLAACAAFALCAAGASARPAKTAPAIINGADLGSSDVALGARWNQLVAVVDTTRGSAYDGQFCGGTLVHERWVLTAAHCLWDDYDGNGTHEPYAAGSLGVVVGREDLEGAGGLEAAVDLVAVHPAYPATGNDDVALLRLAAAVPASVAVPIPLVAAGEDARWAPGTPLFVAGWGNQTATLCGATSCDPAGPASYPSVAAQVEVPRIADATCSANYGATFQVPKMLCAGVLDTDGLGNTTTNGKDSCQGDSGGPLVTDPGTGLAERRVVGVVSFGVGCGSRFYGVYTRVASYRSWLDEVIAGGTNIAQAEAVAGSGGGSGGGGASQDDGDGDGEGEDEGEGEGPAREPQGTTGGGQQPELGAPEQLAVVARSFTTVTVRWQPPLVRGGDVVGYQVESLDGELVEDLDAGARSYVLEGVLPGRAVTIRVRAFGDADGDVSDDAVVSTSTLRDTRKPVLKAAPKLSRKGAGLVVRWAAAKDDDRVAKYRVVGRVGAKWRTLVTVPGSKRSVAIKRAPKGLALVAVQPIDASGNVGARSKPAAAR